MDSSPRPSILAPRFASFPAELISRAQWVLWKAVWKPETSKYNKVPYNARTLQKADSTDPATWSDFETARRAYEKNPAPKDNPESGFAGVGFVLSDADPFCGIDLDHVIDADRVIDAEAKQIIADLDTYAEISPSGTGVRLFAAATLPPGGRKRGDSEIYESGRYLTVTGRKVADAPATIEERQAQIEAHHAKYFPAPPKPKRKTGASTAGMDADDTELLSKATTGKNGAKIAALLSGSTAGYPGASEADFALCSCLAFYTGDDPARLDRLFRTSGLLRDKWDERRYADGSTYGEKTVQRAIEGCREFYQPSTRKPLDADEVKQAADSVQGSKASTSAGDSSGAKTGTGTTSPNSPPASQASTVSVDAIPVPALRTDKGAREYAPYQIAALLQIDAQAPDTHRALAARAVIAFADDLMCCRELGWLRFNGKVWQSDDKQESKTASLFCSLSDTIRAEAGQLFRYVADLIGADRREDADAMMRAAKKHLAHVKNVETEQFVKGAMTLARAAMDAPLSLFMPRPWLIGFPNCVCDRGEIRPHRREDYLLDLAPVHVDMNADKTECLLVLNRITGGDADLMRTLQETAGAVLSGASIFRYIAWLYGVRGSGKSTFSELLTTCLGPELSTTIDPKSLSPDAPRDRLGAVLWKKRLAVCHEAGQQKLEAEAIKTLSGGDTMPVRFHYHEQFTARPTHLLMCVANDPPNMNAYDDALRDRVAAIPCEHLLADGEPLVFSDGTRVEDVRSKVDSALVRGFIAWALEGMVAVYKKQTIYRAPAVQKATERFWRDTDPLTEFWEQFEGWQTDKRGQYVAKNVLYDSYKAWAADQGVRRPLSTKGWVAACRAHGLEEDRLSGGTVRVWRSYAKQEPDPAPPAPEPDPVGAEAVAAFVAAECDRRAGATADFAALLRAYKEWAAATGTRPTNFNYPVFENRLSALPGVSVRKNGSTGAYGVVVGLQLRHEAPKDAPPTPEPDEPPFDDPGFDDPFADYENGGVPNQEEQP